MLPFYSHFGEYINLRFFYYSIINSLWIFESFKTEKSNILVIFDNKRKKKKKKTFLKKNIFDEKGSDMMEIKNFAF